MWQTAPDCARAARHGMITSFDPKSQAGSERHLAGAGIPRSPMAASRPTTGNARRFSQPTLHPQGKCKVDAPR